MTRRRDRRLDCCDMRWASDDVSHRGLVAQSRRHLRWTDLCSARLDCDVSIERVTFAPALRKRLGKEHNHHNKARVIATSIKSRSCHYPSLGAARKKSFQTSSLHLSPSSASTTISDGVHLCDGSALNHVPLLPFMVDVTMVFTHRFHGHPHVLKLTNSSN